MALLQPKFDNGDILVVGDGNFSFSLCLAEALSARKDISIFATSLDPRSSLEGDEVALENLRRLSSFQNVNVLHEVDGTNLAASFPSRTFRRIIFNFPHVGGKSKISLARILLERFFTSAAEHIDAEDGDICVSLCQGQGGTPADNPARDYRNTWQVVMQAAKSGLILNAVWPFQSEDYPHYLSAGFRGKLSKGFHTNGGVTHAFVQGIPLGAIPDVQTFLGQQDSSKGAPLHDRLQLLPAQHPVCLLKKRLDNFFDNCPGAPFTTNPESLTQDIKSSASTSLCCIVQMRHRLASTNLQKDKQNLEVGTSEQASLLENIGGHSVSGGSETDSGSGLTTNSCLSEMKGEPCFYDKIHECLENPSGSFIITDVVVDHKTPVSRTSYPISHRMAVVRITEDSRTEVGQEMRKLLGKLTEDICPNVKVSSSPITETYCHAKVDTLKLLDICESVERSRAGVSRIPAGSYCAGCTCDPQDVQCIFCRLEASYLGLHEIHKPVQWMDKFVDLSTASEFYHQDKLLLSCCLLGERTVGQSRFSCGWMIIINLDNLATVVCKIPDARLLWSCNPKFLEQFKGSQVETSENLVKFMPFSLYPTSFTHDISFWLTEEATEKKFFEAIFKITQDCVRDVFFRERYHDKEQDLVSYNYRMIYSRCDGPLTHLQAVEMQNLLRRYLISLGFGLK